MNSNSNNDTPKGLEKQPTPGISPALAKAMMVWAVEDPLVRPEPANDAVGLEDVLGLALPVSPMHEAARMWAAHQVAVFPCRPGTKTPATDHGHLDATTDPAVIDAWWGATPDYNVAVVPASGDLSVIDRDCDRETGEAIGAQNWEALQREHSAAPDTTGQRTPSGGEHSIFAGVVPSSTSKIAGRVDVKSATGYVLVAPSVVDERDPQAAKYPLKRGAYETTSDVWPPAPLPTWVRDLAESTGEHKPSVRQGDPICKANLIEIAKHVTPKTDRGEFVADTASFKSTNLADGDEADLRTIWDAHAFGGFHGYTRENPVEGYDPEGNEEIWRTLDPDKEGGRGVGSLIKQARANGYGGPIGIEPDRPLAETHAHLVEHADALEPAVDVVAKLQASGVAVDGRLREGLAALTEEQRKLLLKYPGLRPLDYAARRALSDPEFLIEGMLPDEGVTMICGDTRALKTFILIEWLLCLSTGEPVFGKFAVPPGGVETLLMSAEGPRGVSRRREPAWYTKHPQYDPENVPFRLAPGVPRVVDKASVEVAVVWCKMMGYRPRVVAIDTYTRSTSGVSQNDETTFTAFKEMADRFAHEFGAITIVLHHPNKGGKDPRGSGGIRQDVDAMWFVTRPGDQLRTVMKCEKLKDTDDSDLGKLVLAAEEVEFDGGQGPRKSLVLRLADTNEAKAVERAAQREKQQLDQAHRVRHMLRRLGREANVTTRILAAEYEGGQQQGEDMVKFDARVNSRVAMLNREVREKPDGRLASYVVSMRDGQPTAAKDRMWQLPDPADYDVVDPEDTDETSFVGLPE